MISSKLLKTLNAFICKNLEYYSPLTAEDQKKLVDFLHEHNVTELTPLKVIEMRNIYMYILSKTKGTLANRYGDNIYNDYKNKELIVDIANKYELPPMSVLYQILIELKNESHKISKLLADKTKLPKDIQDQLKSVMLSDPELWLPVHRINIYDHIKKLDVPFVYDINPKHGKMPNILFNEPFTYKKKTFKWIEIKKYMLFDNKLLLSDANKTINKFSRFGHGLILYSDIKCSRSFLKKINAYIDTYDLFI